MIRSIAAACLLAALALFSVLPARAADPITMGLMIGYVTSPIPNALKYVDTPPQADHTGGINWFYGMVQYRPKSPAAATTSIYASSKLVQGYSAWQANGSLTFGYDADANTTTITVTNSTDTAQIVVPIDLQQVFADQDPSVAAKTLVVSPKPNTAETNLFSGTVGSRSYSGKLVNYTGWNESFTAYQIFDTNGDTLLYAQANNGGVPNVRMPGAQSAAAAFGAPPAKVTLPPNCGTGSFSETKNGQPLIGTFQPAGFVYLPGFFDASQDAYWSTH